MSYYKKINLFLIFFSLGLVSFLGVLSFTSIKTEMEETEKIDAFFTSFENLNQYTVKDSIKPKVVTYSQLKNFNENDNYLNNRKDVSKNITTYSKITATKTEKKHYDVSSRISTYTEIDNVKKKKKYDVSKLVSVYKEPEKTKKEVSKKTVKTKEKQIPIKKKVKKSKPVIKTISKKISKKPVEVKKPKKIVKKVVVRKPIIKKEVVKKTTIKKTILPKKEVQSTVKKQQVIQKSDKSALQYKKEKEPTLHYKNKVLNTATNINYIQSAPIYPNCDKNLSEDEKKSCLLTNVSKFVLDNFNNNIAKKSGLKKGFYEIRVLFVIDKNGYSKTYKVLGKYNGVIKNEIRRIIDNLPKMIPGKSNGKNVPVKYSIKVLFEVQ